MKFTKCHKSSVSEGEIRVETFSYQDGIDLVYVTVKEEGYFNTPSMIGLSPDEADKLAESLKAAASFRRGKYRG